MAEQIDEEPCAMTKKEVEELLAAGGDPVLERLKSIPGIRLAAHWPPRFDEVEPFKIEGELASERLIRDRR